VESLEPKIGWSTLPSAVAAHRRRHQEVQTQVRATLEPRVAKHLEVYSYALRLLRSFHVDIADRTDLELKAKTRPAAIWQVMGRTLALADAAVWLHQGGFGLETVPTDRALYEASMLLWVFSLSQDDDLIRRWLSDEHWLRPAEIRREAITIERDYNARRILTGDIELSQVWHDAGEVYGRQSAIAHHRSTALTASVSANLRRMPTGPQPNFGIACALLGASGAVISLAVDVSSIAIGRFFGLDHEHELIAICEQLVAVRREYPLNADVTTELEGELVLQHLAHDPRRPEHADADLDMWDDLRRKRGLSPVPRVPREHSASAGA
jgi:hypothetical protein